jgi:hypothetical protein
MPGVTVHFRYTTEWAIAEGMDPLEAEAVGNADIRVDQLWPGHTKWARHFNPTAQLVMGPLEMRRAIAAARAGDRAGALDHLGYSLHSTQDGIGHGLLGLNHLAYDIRLRKDDPDDWFGMPPSYQRRIEAGTREKVRRFLAAAGPKAAAASGATVVATSGAGAADAGSGPGAAPG